VVLRGAKKELVLLHLHVLARADEPEASIGKLKDQQTISRHARGSTQVIRGNQPVGSGGQLNDVAIDDVFHSFFLPGRRFKALIYLSHHFRRSHHLSRKITIADGKGAADFAPPNFSRPRINRTSPRTA
jgi:hypothetical protein